jgi:hypothetical protein
MLDEYTDDFGTDLSKHTVIRPLANQPQAEAQQQYTAQHQIPTEQYQQPQQPQQPQYLRQESAAPQYQAPIYQQHVYQQPVFQTPTINPGQPVAPAMPQNIYQPPQQPGVAPQPQGENTRINNVFNEESKELTELLKAEQNGGCLKTSFFIIICIVVVGASFWASFTLGSKVFFPDSKAIKSMFPSMPAVAHKVKQALSTADVIKVEAEFKHDLDAEPSTPILPPEVRPQPAEVKPQPLVQKARPKPLAKAVRQASNPTLKKGMYRVVAGAYTTRKEAADVLANIKADGFPSYIYQADNKFRIQIGAFKTKAAAEELRKKALEYGYNAFVSIY